jgi:hypothetical protein
MFLKDIVGVLQWAQGPILTFIVVMVMGIGFTIWSYRELYPEGYKAFARRQVPYPRCRSVIPPRRGLNLRRGPDGKLSLQ